MQQPSRPLTIALAGNPNSGKTTLFNALTGSSQRVGNWPGVTIERKLGTLRGYPDVTVVDLPGVYSLSPFSPEEVVSRDFLTGQKPDAVLNIVDGTNLERNLFLTTQLLELGIPTVVAINMMDVVAASGDKINLRRLGESLGCPVVSISALKGTGINEASEVVVAAAQTGSFRAKHRYSPRVEQALSLIGSVCKDVPEVSDSRWYLTRLLVRDTAVADRLGLSDAHRAQIENAVSNCETALDDDADSIMTSERYAYLADILTGSYCKANVGELTLSDKIDRIVTNAWLAMPIFALVMFLVYYIAVSAVGKWITDWTNDVLFGDIVPTNAERLLNALHVQDWLKSLILDGIIAGVGGVLGFVPQLLLLFAMLAFLEASGYMARVAFIMDRFFRRVGLSGKSFIPLLIGTGCSVPGIMATRTIDRERDRKMTIITTSFIPCSAKLTVIALISGALFHGAWWVAPSAYFVGIAAVVISGILLRKTILFSSDSGPFVMELPAYRMPSLRSVAMASWERGWSFIKKAGTVILLATVITWFLSNFGFHAGRLGRVEDLGHSFMANLGHLISWIFIPLGFGDWQSTVAAITGLLAKETIVGTFGVLFGVNTQSDTGTEIWSNVAAHFTALAGYSFLVFNLLCAPCIAAMGAIRREMNNSKWTWFAIGYMTGFAWCAALVVYQIGGWILNGTFGFWTVVAIGIVLAALIGLFRPNVERRAASPSAIAHPQEGAA